MGEKKKKGKDSIFYYTLGIIVFVIAAIFLFPKLIHKEPTIKTIDDIIKDTLTDGESENTRIYNGFVFVREGPIWYTQVRNPDTNNLYNFGVRFNPIQVENITIEGNVDESFRTGDVYITFEPYDDELAYISLASTELSLNLARAMGVNVTAACMEEHPHCVNREIITCNNTDKPVIEIINSDEAKLVMDGNCMRIQGREFELLRVVDRVIFQAYGIMEK